MNRKPRYFTSCFSSGGPACQPGSRPYQDLANAIVAQAAEDYREARYKLSINPDNRRALGVVNEINRFADGSWCSVLTDVDFKTVIRIIDREDAVASKKCCVDALAV